MTMTSNVVKFPYDDQAFADSDCPLIANLGTAAKALIGGRS